MSGITGGIALLFVGIGDAPTGGYPWLYPRRRGHLAAAILLVPGITTVIPNRRDAAAHPLDKDTSYYRTAWARKEM